VSAQQFVPACIYSSPPHSHSHIQEETVEVPPIAQGRGGAEGEGGSGSGDESDCYTASSKGPVCSIQYISLDTEGSEAAILGAFPFERYFVVAMSIERNGDRFSCAACVARVAALPGSGWLLVFVCVCVCVCVRACVRACVLIYT